MASLYQELKKERSLSINIGDPLKYWEAVNKDKEIRDSKENKVVKRNKSLKDFIN